MNTRIIVPLLLAFCVIAVGCAHEETHADNPTQTPARTVVSINGDVPDTSDRVVKSDTEWRKILTDEEYFILREKGTEPAFTGKYWNNHEQGIYYCAACGNPLYSSETKFESGTGWPSFWQPIEPGRVYVAVDNSYGMVRDEVLCNRCRGHLGHVFDDGPKPTGLRYCMNSAALEFRKSDK